MGELRIVRRAKGIFLNPKETMDEILSAPSIVDSFIFVGVYSVLIAIQAFVLLDHIVASVSGNNSLLVDNLNLALWSGALPEYLLSIILIFVFWIFIAAGLDTLAKWAGGQGPTFTTLLSAIGYTYIFKIIAVVIQIVLLIALPTINVNLSLGSSVSSADQIPLSVLQHNILFISGSIIALIGIVLSSYLGYVAIKKGYGLSKENAMIIIGLPLLLWIFYAIGKL